MNGVRIRQVWSYHDETQHTEYEGTREGLIAVGVGTPDMFEVGRSGVKRRSGWGMDPSETRYYIRRMARGIWRLTRSHKIGRPPYIPRDQHVVAIDYHGNEQIPVAAVFECQSGDQGPNVLPMRKRDYDRAHVQRLLDELKRQDRISHSQWCELGRAWHWRMLEALGQKFGLRMGEPKPPLRGRKVISMEARRRRGTRKRRRWNRRVRGLQIASQ